jgi:MFS family permease
VSTATQAEKPAQTIHASQPATPPGPRARLLSTRFALLLMASFGALTSFFLLLSVTPIYAAAGGAGTSEVGLVTGSLMLATVMAELASARLMRRYGYRLVFAAGAFLLGGPTLVLLASHSVAAIVVVSIARGIGFGLNTVVIGALVAAVLPAGRRGEGIGLAGAVESVPAIIALPSGVWLAHNTGFALVIVLTAASALAPLAAVPWLAAPAADQEADPAQAPSAGLLASVRSGGQLRPSLIFAATTVSAGVIVAFVPLAGGVSAGTAALGLLVQAAASTVSRWWAGRYGDRHGHSRLLVPALLIATAGMMMLIWVATPAPMLAGLCLFGIGFGISENATFAVMIDRVPSSDYGTASALWSLAYDGGYGAGPVLFGLFVIHTGYPAAFAITGLVMIVALIPAIRDRAAGGTVRPAGGSSS